MSHTPEGILPKSLSVNYCQQQKQERGLLPEVGRRICAISGAAQDAAFPLHLGVWAAMTELQS